VTCGDGGMSVGDPRRFINAPPVGEADEDDEAISLVAAACGVGEGRTPPVSWAWQCCPAAIIQNKDMTTAQKKVPLNGNLTMICVPPFALLLRPGRLRIKASLPGPTPPSWPLAKTFSCPHILQKTRAFRRGVAPPARMNRSLAIVDCQPGQIIGGGWQLSFAPLLKLSEFCYSLTSSVIPFDSIRIQSGVAQVLPTAFHSKWEAENSSGPPRVFYLCLHYGGKIEWWREAMTPRADLQKGRSKMAHQTHFKHGHVCGNQCGQ
jgi:hypothetical protein